MSDPREAPTALVVRSVHQRSEPGGWGLMLVPLVLVVALVVASLVG